MLSTLPKNTQSFFTHCCYPGAIAGNPADAGTLPIMTRLTQSVYPRKLKNDHTMIFFLSTHNDQQGAHCELLLVEKTTIRAPPTPCQFKAFLMLSPLKQNFCFAIGRTPFQCHPLLTTSRSCYSSHRLSQLQHPCTFIYLKSPPNISQRLNRVPLLTIMSSDRGEIYGHSLYSADDSPTNTNNPTPTICASAPIPPPPRPPAPYAPNPNYPLTSSINTPSSAYDPKVNDISTTSKPPGQVASEARQGPTEQEIRNSVRPGALCYKAIEGEGPGAQLSKRLASRSRIRLIGLILLLSGIGVGAISLPLHFTSNRVAAGVIDLLGTVMLVAGGIMMCTVGCCCAQ